MREFAGIVRIEQTEIGRGVFACRGFRKGEVVGAIRGRVIRDPHHGSSYCIAVDDGCVLEPRAPFRFLNHSCQPNCEVYYHEDERPAETGTLWLQTLRAVRPGAQLTIDYAWPADAAIPCGCRSRECRGWVVSRDELHLLAPLPAPVALRIDPARLTGVAERTEPTERLEAPEMPLASEPGPGPTRRRRRAGSTSLAGPARRTKATCAEAATPSTPATRSKRSGDRLP
jgi:hypothetical protein